MTFVSQAMGLPKAWEDDSFRSVRGSFLTDIASLSVRRPKTVLALFGLIALGSVLGLQRLKQEEDLMVFLPTGDHDVQLFKDVSRRFGGLRVALIGVETAPEHDVFGGDAIAKLTAATDAIKNVRGVDRVTSLTAVADVVAGPTGAEVAQLVQKVPSTPEEERALKVKVLSRDHIAGSLVSKDGRAALIVVFLAEGISDRQVTDGLRAAAEKTLRPLAVYYGGAPFAGRAIYEEAQRDVWKLSPLSLAMLLLVVILAFRDPVGVVLTTASVAFSLLVVLGGMGWWGEKFTVASSTLSVMLFASGSSYAVNVLGRYYLLRAHESSPDSLRGSLRIVAVPLLIAAATTSEGFFSFGFTDVRPMRAFGIACGVGVLLCWLTSITLVPAVVALFPRKPRRELELKLIGAALVAIWRWSRRHSTAVILVCTAAGVALLPPMLRVRVRMEPRSFFSPGSEPWLAEKFLEDRFGGAHFVQVEAHADLDDPASLRELERLSDFARSLPGVTQVGSVLQPLRLVNDAMGGGRRLPSTASQASNLYFFIEGEAGMSSMIATGRKQALLQVRVRGDATPVVAALEQFATERLRKQPTLPTPDDIADRVAWVVHAVTGRAVDLARLQKTLKVVDAPGDLDEEWMRRRGEVAKAFLGGDEAPPMTDDTRGKLVQLAQNGGPGLEAALKAAAPSPEEGGLAYQALVSRLSDERRTLAVNRALPLVLDSAGISSVDTAVDPQLRAQLEPILDDRFPTDVMRAAAPTAVPMTARVGGEPILDRGFSRSVEHNQLRSLEIAIVAVFLTLIFFFRSAVLSAICMAPSLLTMVLLFGAMGLFGIHIDLGTSLVAGIATGAGSDFAMNYLWYLRRQSADEVSRTVGPVMVVSILLVSLGFFVMALGHSPVMRLFGTLAGLSMSVSALLSCLLLPALLNKFGKDLGQT
jgi:predicted RND superfamily exporter protein